MADMPRAQRVHASLAWIDMLTESRQNQANAETGEAGYDCNSLKVLNSNHTAKATKTECV